MNPGGQPNRGRRAPQRNRRHGRRGPTNPASQETYGSSDDEMEAGPSGGQSQEEKALLEKYSVQIRSLKLQFGAAGLDDTVLANVLEMVDGDVQTAIQFLAIPEEGAGTYIDARQQRDASEEYFSSIQTSNPSRTPVQDQTAAAGQSEEDPIAFIRSFITNKLTETPLTLHLKYLDEHPTVYIAVITVLTRQGFDMTASNKAKVLASLLSRHHFKFFAELMASPDGKFGVAELMKAFNFLDGPRLIRSHEKRIARLQVQNTAKPKTYSAIRRKIEEVKKEIGDADCSVTSSIVKTLRKWTKSLTPSQLEFFVLYFPAEPWVNLANITHLRPSDFQLPWFLDVQHGKPAPPESMVSIVRGLGDSGQEAWEHAVQTHDIPIAVMRKKFDISTFSEFSKRRIAQYSTLEMVIWYWEQLSCPAVDAVIVERVLNGEAVKFTYGKLMERLLTMSLRKASFLSTLLPKAEEKLVKATSEKLLSLPPPVVVLGDASYSMDVAIRVSTIIGSLVSALTQAELRFFGTSHFSLPEQPRTIQQVLDAAQSVKADGMTNPCGALKYYYTHKIKVTWFFVISDEMENMKEDELYFPQLFDKYHKEVAPAKLIFISFLDNTQKQGRMCEALQRLNHSPLMYRLHARQPDLSKLDSILAGISSQGELFDKLVKEIIESPVEKVE